MGKRNSKLVWCSRREDGGGTSAGGRYIGWLRGRGRGRGVPTSDWKTVDAQDGSPKRLTAIRYPLVIPDWCDTRDSGIS